MTNEERELYEELKAKPQLKPAEKAKLKALEKKAANDKKNDTPKPKRNETFGLTATTKLASVPFRISEIEKKIMTDSRAQIEGTELFYDKLGGKDDLSNNMQMRAALWAYAALSPEQKVEMIRKAKLSMVRTVER
ncbi:hypothetical protein K6O87_004158 [Vibrio vulnificus]|nr:hypothetical protein [Vibrio vulnificus]